MIVKAVFFDLGATLGEAILSVQGRLLKFQAYDFAAPILRELRAAGIPRGIISNTGNERAPAVDAVLDAAGLLSFFDDLRVYSAEVGKNKPDPEIYKYALTRAGLTSNPEYALFVGEDASDRAGAAAIGMRVVPHPKLVMDVISGASLHYARLTPPSGMNAAQATAALSPLAVVPLRGTGESGQWMYCVASERALAQVAELGFGVTRVGTPGLPDQTDLFLLRDDVAAHGAADFGGRSTFLSDHVDSSSLVLAVHAEGTVVALPAGRDLGEFHFPETKHGHTVRLCPSLEPLAFSEGVALADFAPVTLPNEVAEVFRGIDAASIRDSVERYSGARPVDSASTTELIKSRHVKHAGNAVATEALIAELERIAGARLQVRRHSFTHRGKSLFNIEAELSGPAGAPVTLVTAHLDSTAAGSAGYEEGVDPAPGADDDASGVAAVLAIAQRYASLPDEWLPGGSVRFVLFNCEEEGLVGSQAYARLQRSLGTRIAAMFQMDMIGYNVQPPLTWEAHAGCASRSDVEQKSLGLCELLRQSASSVSNGLEPVQIYRSPDPADGRSDHSSFQSLGYPACVISGDFFAGPDAESPGAEGNVNYHTRQDTFVDENYACQIARVVAAASWVAARASAGSVGG